MYNDGSDYDEKEELSNILEDIKPDISKFLEKKGLVLSELEVDDEETFSIQYDPSSFNGSIPNKISYYLEELSEYLSEEIGPKISWGFGPNGSATLVIFNLENPLEPKYVKAKKLLRRGLF
jgi:hypothetical protein